MCQHMTTPRDPDYWWLQALCRGHWAWFDSVDDMDGKPHYPYLTEAQALCAKCHVFDDCDERRKKESTGIWGGIPL
jgi:hypothetical protein